MSDQRRPSDATSDPILQNGNLSDSQVADVLVSGFPTSVRVLVGADMRELIQFAIRRERARAGAIAAQGAASQAARAGGVTPDARLATHGARCLYALSRMIQDPPGSCGRCGGARRVTSGISGPGGQPLLVACPACSSAPEPSGASVSEISDAKDSDPG